MSLAVHAVLLLLLSLWVSAAAIMTHAKAQLFVPPRFAFFGQRSEQYPYSTTLVYVPQPAFRVRLREALREESARLMAGVRILDQARRPFLARRVDWEYEYRQESSKRWRAWYDLTRGR